MHVTWLLIAALLVGGCSGILLVALLQVSGDVPS